MAPAAEEVAPPAAPVAVVAVPFPAQGHLNQMLHLSLLLASRGLDVHYAAPAPHVRQARARVQGWDVGAVRSLSFTALDIPPYETPPPDPDSPIAFPGHLQPLFDAFCDHAAAPLGRLLEELAASHRRVVVVHDNLMDFPASEASRLPNCEAYALQCVGQSFCTGFKEPGHCLVRELGLPVPSPETFLTEEFMGLVQRQGGLGAPGAGMLLNSCRALEGDFIDALDETLSLDGKKLFTIGPLNPLLDLDATTHAPSSQLQPRHECLDWLDKQPVSSVLYVSFGTMSSLPGKQIEELATALQASEQRFIWVLRDADRADIFADAGGKSRHGELLSEFTKQTEGKGLVITGWAPQLEILAHDATAAFVSHCGWNSLASLLEGLGHGIPILAWPMHSDQPWNAAYVCGHLKAGIIARPWEKSRETLPAKDIQDVIKRAMDSDEGVAARKAAKGLAEDVRAAVAEGGSSWAHMEEFIGHITK